jgi:hypothetical protein
MIRFATENTTNRDEIVTELILEERTYSKASSLSFISPCDHVSLASFFLSLHVHYFLSSSRAPPPKRHRVSLGSRVALVLLRNLIRKALRIGGL